MADQEYGLQELAALPLLEQVHRLLHAISMGYPYKETSGWKTLPLDSKRKILQYIKENKPKGDGMQPLPPIRHAPPKGRNEDEDDDYDNECESSDSKKKTVEDLEDLPIQSQVQPTTKTDSDTFLATLKSRSKDGKYNMKWSIDKQFPINGVKPTCGCGEIHDTNVSDPVTREFTTMMTTFGDTDSPCESTAIRIKSIVKKQIKKVLDASNLQQYSLLDLTQLFSEEAMYYGRWKDFKSQAKDDETPEDAQISDDLVDELDLFASYESMELNAFQLYFLDRMKFADIRTKEMDPFDYLSFSKKRTTNFMNQSNGFLQWLDIGQCTRASLEFLNFVVYNKIGRLVEEAIKKKHQGALVQLDRPLTQGDIIAVVQNDDPPEPPQVRTIKRKEPAELESNTLQQGIAPTPPTKRLKRLR